MKERKRNKQFIDEFPDLVEFLSRVSLPATIKEGGALMTVQEED